MKHGNTPQWRYEKLWKTKISNVCLTKKTHNTNLPRTHNVSYVENLHVTLNRKEEIQIQLRLERKHIRNYSWNLVQYFQHILINFTRKKSKMLEHTILRPLNSQWSWNDCVLPTIPNTSDKHNWRIVVDYAKINKHSKSN